MSNRSIRISLRRWVSWSTVAVIVFVAIRTGIGGPPELSATRVIHCGVGDDQRPAVVTGVAITPDGTTIAVATDDHFVSLWNADTGALKRRIDSHGDWVQSVGMSSDGAILATGAGDRTVCLWSLKEDRRLCQLPACDNAIAAVCFHPNCQQLAVVGFCNSLQIVDIATGKSTQRRDCPCADLRTVAFAPNGERMAVAGRNGPLRIWSVAENVSERDIEIDGRPIRAMAFSPDGRLLATAGEGPHIRISDVATGAEVLAVPARPAKVFAVQFVDNGHLAVGGSDNRIRIWDLENRVISCQLVGHTGTVAALACDVEGKTLVSGSYDTTVRVWNLGAEETPAMALRAEPEQAR